MSKDVYNLARKSDYTNVPRGSEGRANPLALPFP